LPLPSSGRLSGKPAVGLFPEPDEFSMHPPNLCVRDHFNIILPFTSASSEWFLSLRLSVKRFERISHFAMRSVYLTHFIFLDLIRFVFGEEYKYWTFSLCSFLRPSVTSFVNEPRTKIEDQKSLLKEHASVNGRLKGRK
jgi:hypothetical protein